MTELETLKAQVQALTDRNTIIETVTRFLCSLDDGDPDLLHSTLTEDMLMDLTALSKAGAEYSSFSGRDNVVETMMKTVGKTMDSAHHVSNFLVDLKGDEARVSCYALAQHFRLGQGPSHEHDDYCMMGNKYDVKLIRTDSEGGWRIKFYAVDCMWSQGNVEVMKAMGDGSKN